MRTVFTAALTAALVCAVFYVLRPAEAARNASGTMSAANGPYVSHTLIRTTDMNTRLADIESELTNSLDRGGRGGMTAALRGIDGTVAAPAFSWTSEAGSGMYRIGAGDLGLAILGSKRGEWTANGLRVTDGAVATPSLSFFNDTGSGFYRIGSNDIGFAINGTKTHEWTSSGETVTGTLAVSGATTATGGITIGGSGTAIVAIYSGTASLTPAAVSAQTCNNASTVTVTGAALGDLCIGVDQASGVSPSLSVTCAVGGANQVNVVFCNPTSGSVTPRSGTYRASVIHH